MGATMDIMNTCNGGYSEDRGGNAVGSKKGFTEDFSPHGGYGDGGGRGGGGGGGDFGEPQQDQPPSDQVQLNRQRSRQAHQEAVTKAREWQRQIRTEQRQLDRDINRIRTEENKVKQQIKQMAAKGQVQSVQQLAKQVVRSRKSIERLERTKCSMTALNLGLTTSIASASSAGALKMSADIMKEMNQLMSVPELSKTIQEMKAEMAKAEIADECMEEAFEASDDETAIESEIAKVFDELALDTSRLLGTTGGPAPVPPSYATIPSVGHAAPQGGDPLHQRLSALQS